MIYLPPPPRSSRYTVMSGDHVAAEANVKVATIRLRIVHSSQQSLKPTRGEGGKCHGQDCPIHHPIAVPESITQQ